MGYTKLADDFAESSTCDLGLDAVGLWALILSKTRPGPDGEGLLATPPSYFAKITRADPARVLELFAAFEAPDPSSRSRTHEGRKLVPVEGGWHVINYRQIRETDSTAAERAKAYRERRKAAGVTPTSRSVTAASRRVTVKTQAEAEAEAEAERTNVPAAKPRAKSGSWTEQAADDWIDRYGGTAQGGMIGKALKPLVGKYGWEKVRQAWRSYLEGSEAQYASPARFAATYGEWGSTAPVAPKGEAPAPLPAPDGEGPEVWRRIQASLAEVMPLQSWATWFRPVRGLRLEGGVLTLAVPGPEWVTQLRTVHVERLRAACEKVGWAGLKFLALPEPPENMLLHNGSVR